MHAKMPDRGNGRVPKALRNRLGIRPGTLLDFTEEEGRLVAVKAEPLDAVDKVFGGLRRRRRTDETMRERRVG